eukprot:jgi/Bigna1/84912/estExt_fgenesh1_pg.C_10347
MASKARSLPSDIECENVCGAYSDFKKATTPDQRDKALVAFLNAHPFVQKKTPQVLDYEKHSIEITGFRLEIFKFRKWLNSKRGRPYKSVAGGMSDDGLYTVSPMLRELMPRGLHRIIVTSKGGGKGGGGGGGGTKRITRIFKGIPKFSGLVASDEDEESNASAAIFFYDGKTINDAGGFYTTAKSNGENAKLGCLVADEIPYLVAGSKNTCMVWPAEQPVEKYVPADNPSVPAQFICLLYSNWFLGLSKEQRSLFVSEMSQKYGTIMAEINTPWYEHIVPINSLYMECYSVHPKDAFTFFKSFGIDQIHPTMSAPVPPKRKKPISPGELEDVLNKESHKNRIRASGGYKLDGKKYIGHVYFKQHTIQELEGVVNEIRDMPNTEGAVLYLTDAKSDAVIGLVKVKSSEYVIRRRLRENLKGGLFGPLRRGEIKEFPPSKEKLLAKSGSKKKNQKKAAIGSKSLNHVLGVTRDRIYKGCRKLTHVPGCSELWEEWFAFGKGFSEWWVESRLLNGYNPEKVNLEAVLEEAKIRIASLYAEYVAISEEKQR